MKKKTTLVNQPGKTETTQAGFFTRYFSIHITYYRDHHFCDHTHGRVNRHPFGGGQGPIAF